MRAKDQILLAFFLFCCQFRSQSNEKEQRAQSRANCASTFHTNFTRIVKLPWQPSVYDEKLLRPRNNGLTFNCTVEDGK